MKFFILLLASFLATAVNAQQISWALSRDGQYTVQIGRGPDGSPKAVVLNKGNWSASDPRWEKSLSAGLSAEIDGKPVPVTIEKGPVEWSSSNPSVGTDFRVKMYDHTLGWFRQNGHQPFATIIDRPLSTSNIRNFTTNKSYGPTSFIPDENSSEGGNFATDLHNHLAGHLTSDSLYDLAYEANISYPIALLKKNGIGYSADQVSGDKIPFRALVESAEFKASDGLPKLKASWVIGDTIRTIRDMGARYEARDPITKEISAFRGMLWEAARTTAQSGVKYVEFSFGKIIDPDWLQIAVDELPKIETETGVRMKFMASLWRHSDEAWNMDELKRTEILMRDFPDVIVGIDFMGAETNSSTDIQDQIRAARRLKSLFPHIQIRVHAGENSLFPENVRVAAQSGADRIGHGIYTEKDIEAFRRDPWTAKIDPKTLETLKTNHILVEFCPSSNEALNNLSGGRDILRAQARQLMEAGVDFTFNTDGVGMYSGDHRDIFRLLKSWGFTPDIFEYARASEKRYLADQRLPPVDPDRKVMSRAELEAKVDPTRRYTPELKSKLEDERAAHRVELLNDLRRKGITDYDPNNFRGKSALLLLGSSQKQFEELAQGGRMGEPQLRELWRNALPMLDPKKVFFVTDGMPSGSADIVQKAVASYNSQLPEGQKGFRVVGTFPESTDAQEVHGPAEGGITDFQAAGRNRSASSSGQMEILAKNGGAVVGLGGDMFDADTMRTSTNNMFMNKGYKTLLMEGLPGASAKLARENLSLSFKTAPELLAQLAGEKPERYVRPEFYATIHDDAAILGRIQKLDDVQRIRLIIDLRDKLQSQGGCK